MKILEVVIGSNHFFIHPQTVGKKPGAPMTWEVILAYFLGRVADNRWMIEKVMWECPRASGTFEAFLVHLTK